MSTLNTAQALRIGADAVEYRKRRRAAGWQVGFCFTFRGGTLGALGPFDSTFPPEFYLVVEPQVLKRTSEECTHNPEAHGFWVHEKTPAHINLIPFALKFVHEIKDKYGDERFMFSPSHPDNGSAALLSEKVNKLAHAICLALAPGLRFTSPCKLRGMLSEFVLCSPPVHPLLIPKRLHWKNDYSSYTFAVTWSALSILLSTCRACRNPW